MDVLLQKEKNIEIFYNEADHWIYTNWIGFQTTGSVKEGCMHILDWLMAKSCRNILNDNTLVEGMWSGAARWGADFWFPKLREVGLEKFAWIYSPSMLSQLSTDKTISLMPVSYIKTFYNIEDAKAWLREQ